MLDENANIEKVVSAKEIEALFVQTAHRMTYQDGLVTLHGVAPTTLMFSDRPERVTGHLPTEEFVDSWKEGEDNFADVPPNAVLSIFDEKEVHNVVVVLGEPVLENDQVTYLVEILDGEMPKNGGACALFVDVIGRPLTPISVAGANRRGRRRARRRRTAVAGAAIY